MNTMLIDSVTAANVTDSMPDDKTLYRLGAYFDALYIACNRKTTQMRFASKTFDRYRNELRNIDSFEALDAFYARVNLAGLFRNFAASQDGITASDKEWEETLPYLMPQLKALVSRYTPLGENAFYKLYLEIDDVVKAAV